DEDAQVARESLVPGRAAQFYAKINPRFDRAALDRDFHGLDPDVVGVFHGPDQPAAVKGDVELAGQIVKMAVVDDPLGQLMAERGRVNQLVRVNAGSRAGGEVADVVRARAARVQADALDAPQHLRGVF